MRIKASLLMPVLAALTIVAIVGTGIALDQLRNGAPWVTLLSSVPGLGAGAGTGASVEANAGSPRAGSGQLPQPTAQPVLCTRSVHAAKPATAGQGSETLAFSPGLGVSGDYPGAEVNDDSTDLVAPTDRSFDAENHFNLGIGEDLQPPGSADDRFKEDPEVEVPAVQLAAADFEGRIGLAHDEVEVAAADVLVAESAPCAGVGAL
jgi:hypothetical protein